MIFDGLLPAMIGMTIAVTGVNVARTVFWTIPGTFLSGKAAAGGFALVNTIGILGGYFSPLMVDWLKDVTGTFGAGVIGMAVLLGIAVILIALRTGDTCHHRGACVGKHVRRSRARNLT